MGKRLERASQPFRDLAIGFGVGIIIWYLGSFVHEGAHWLVIMPAGGWLKDWHWLSPGWQHVWAPEPSMTLAQWAGGLVAGMADFLLLLLVLLIIAIRFATGKPSGVWWYLGAGLTLVMFHEFTTAVFEGRFHSAYGGPVYGVIDTVLAFAGLCLFSLTIPKHVGDHIGKPV